MSSAPTVSVNPVHHQRNLNQIQFHLSISVPRRTTRRSNSNAFLPSETICPNRRASNSHPQHVRYSATVHGGTPASNLYAPACTFFFHVASFYPFPETPTAPFDVIFYAGILLFDVNYDFSKHKLRLPNQGDTAISHLLPCRTTYYIPPTQLISLPYCVQHKTLLEYSASRPITLCRHQGNNLRPPNCEI